VGSICLRHVKINIGRRPCHTLPNPSAPCYDKTGMSPYDTPKEQHPPDKKYHPCEHCNMDDEPTHPVMTGGGILTLCATCRADVVGGS